jgi:non-specific serine/threonine protein kinase
VKQRNRIIFPPFRLDAGEAKLYRGDETLSLRPKTFAVLRHLLERAGRLVTKDELLDACWPETHVGDAVLKVCIREIRELLGDDPKHPRFIETDHRRGYRFIGEVRESNLPLQMTSFIGREREILEVRQRFDGARLLTLTGAGGSGKTRLAIEAAASLIDETEDGVWWVDLASIADPERAAQAVASTLGAREEPARPLIDTLIDFLKPRRLILALDNCEHLIDACARISLSLLQHCPRLRILATSREPLSIPGEVVWPVPEMSLPRADDPLTPDEIMQYEATRLFVERAVFVSRDFELNASSAAAVAQICNRLDGIPLAIELAAARVRILTAEQIAERLDDCFRLLASSSRSSPARHHTLRAAMDWSYDLLSAKERALFARLSVFAGGFTLEAAESVCAGEGISREEIFDLLSHLIDKSLVVSSRSLRHRLLETVRQYARERLNEEGTSEIVSRRHTDYCLALAEEAEPHLNGASRRAWLERLESERDNLRAALRWSCASDPPQALRLAGAVWWYWFHQGHFSEGSSWLDSVLKDRSQSNLKSEIAKALLGSGVLAWTQGDQNKARENLEQSVDLCRETGDKRGLAHALNFLSSVLLGQSRYETARLMAEESLEIFRQIEDEWGLGIALTDRGIIALAEEDYAVAQMFLEEGANVFRAMGDNWSLALPLRNLGIVALRRGDYEKATSLLRESLRILKSEREKWFISRSVETLAVALALQGDYRAAVKLFGAGENLRRAIGVSLLPFYRSDYDRGVGEARVTLGEEDFQSLWAEGCRMTIDEIIAYALEEPRSATAGRKSQ